MFIRAAAAFIYTLAPIVFVGPGPGGATGAPARAGVDEPVAEEKKVEEPAVVAVECATAYPHPVITEVLFAVPSGEAGDANGDGKRHVSGDEFVELYNPHDKAIQLRGYVLTDSNEPGKGQMRFVFPTLELPAGGMVVVFNGFQCSWFGPVGDGKVAATSGNERFGGAWVFTMKAESQYVALSNSGDHVLLSAPDGAAVQRVSWGEAKEEAKEKEGEEALVEDRAMLGGKGSVQRDSLSRVASFRSHVELPVECGGGKWFSPGVWEAVPEPKKKKGEEGEGNKQEEGKK